MNKNITYNYMEQFIQFYYNVNDPLALSTTIIVNPGLTNYISQTYFSYPIYDFTNIQIGYLAGVSDVQQITNSLYEIKINATYHLGNVGSISWQYAFLDSSIQNSYPQNIANAGPITSSTQRYYSKTGIVSLTSAQSGRNEVAIKFITSL